MSKPKWVLTKPGRMALGDTGIEFYYSQAPYGNKFHLSVNGHQEGGLYFRLDQVKAAGERIYDEQKELGLMK